MQTTTMRRKSVATLLSCALAACLSSCDPMSSRDITIHLNDSKDAAKTVFAVIDTNFTKASLHTIDHFPSAMYEGDFSDQGPTTHVMIMVTYRDDPKRIVLNSGQWMAAQFTSKMKAVMDKTQREINETGKVSKIDVK
jgi:hypothetical protein